MESVEINDIFEEGEARGDDPHRFIRIVEVVQSRGKQG